MNRRSLLLAAAGLAAAPRLLHARSGVAVIGNANLPRIDTPTLYRIYTGKLLEVGGVTVTPVNLASGNPLRGRFLQNCFEEDDEKYIAYWTVRRYVGKGLPPRELGSTGEIIQFVQSTPGALGYIDEGEVRPGLNVLLVK